MVCQGITSFLMYSVDTEIRGITLDAAGELPDAGAADALSSLATISHIKMAVAIDFYAGRSHTTRTYTHARRRSSHFSIDTVATIPTEAFTLPFYSLFSLSL